MRSPWKSVFKWSVVVAAVVGIVYFAHPYTWPGEQYNKAVAMKAVFNGKQIAFLLHEKEGHRPRYPSEFPPGTTAVAYLNYLVKDGLLSEEDRKLLSIPGIPAVPPGIALSDRFIGFTLFRISPTIRPKPSSSSPSRNSLAIMSPSSRRTAKPIYMTARMHSTFSSRISLREEFPPPCPSKRSPPKAPSPASSPPSAPSPSRDG